MVLDYFSESSLSDYSSCWHCQVFVGDPRVFSVLYRTLNGYKEAEAT